MYKNEVLKPSSIRDTCYWKVEWNAIAYFSYDLNFSVSQAVVIRVLAELANFQLKQKKKNDVANV